MTAPTPESTEAAAPPMSLAARVAGVIFSPRATYANVAKYPRWLGVFLVIWLVTSAAAMALLSTDVGQSVLLDQQIAGAEAYGRHLSQAQIDQFQKFAPYSVYVAPGIQLVFFGFAGLVISGIAFAVLAAAMGGDATFKETFAVVAHSGVILALLSLFTTPLAYARESLSSATSLAVFFPFLDDSTFVARLLGSIDLNYIWWMLSVSIGLGVLYRKRTGPIAITLLVVYLVIGAIIAAIKTASAGV